MERTELGKIISEAAEGRGFIAYEGTETPELERLRGELFGLVDRVLAAGAPPEALADLQARVSAQLGDAGSRHTLYDHVSAPRVDRDMRWEGIFHDVNARYEGSNAVHLELGTWTAWPRQRQEALADALSLSEVIRMDFEPTYELDMVADARRIPLKDNSVDRIGADSVLEHIPHPHEVLRECFRVLRPGGAMFFITPFTFNLHGYPDDYLRYTPSWYEQMCREIGFETVAADVGQAQGLYYTLHNTAKAARVDPNDPAAPALRTLHTLVIELLATLVALDKGFEGAARHWFTAVHCVAIKGGGFHPNARERNWDVPFVDRCADLLGAPGTGAPLRREPDAFVDDSTGKRYPIVDGIPRFSDGPAKPEAPRQAGFAGRALRAAKRKLTDR
jgi:SAM-dependent methyltransferase